MMTWLAIATLVLQTGDIERHRNLGKAYYERGDYALAVDELTAVLDSSGAGARDYFNAGMAYLQNAQQDEALAVFTTAKQMDPEMIEVDFGLGVLYKRQLRYPLARESFLRVAERDGDDPSTWLNLGAVTFSMQRLDEAEQAFEKVRRMGYTRAQNFYVSSLFRIANILARRGEQAAAQALFEEFQALRDITPNVSLTPTALENGRYGRLEIPVSRNPTIDPRPTEVVLTKDRELRFSDSPCEQDPSLALGDYDADGDADLFLASPCGGALFRNEGDADLALAGSWPPSSGAAFADLDNSGFSSLYTWSAVESHLYRHRDGELEERTPEELSAGSSTAVFFDADNDGRPDLFASHAEGGIALYRNLDDGRFARIWEKESVTASAAAAGDLDENGFMDIILVQVSGEGLLLRNEGGSLEPSALALNLHASSGARFHILDLNHDGWLDVTGPSTLVNRRGRLELLPTLHGWESLVPLELDGDGYTSFLGRNAGGGRALVSYQGGERFGARPLTLPDDLSGVVIALDRKVLSADREGTLRSYERTKPASPAWLRIALEGTKTNRQALGAVVELKAGRFYQKHLYPGHPITVFVGERDRIDVLRISWANGVIQNELDVRTGQALVIEEAEQMTSSCPFLYVWNGRTFEFLTDVVGRAPLGEILPDGSLVVPNPEDYVRIAPDAMAARENRFVFQLTEELRELAAIDAVELLAVDHPADVEVYTNERFSAPPFEPYRLYTVRESWSPAEAHDHQGKDVLPELTHADGRHVTSFARHRILGFAEEQAIVLSAPEVAGNEPWRLFLSGWVLWPSSSSMKALVSHRSMTMRPPVLQVKDDSGAWVTVIDDLGLPAGIDRTIVADLTGKFLSSDPRVRILTNFAVYWDRAFFATGTNATTRTQVLAPSASDLHYRGFSSVSLDERERPERYDYTRLMAPPWNAVPGRYTRYGDVRSLLAEKDGELVVMAPGDEMTLSFDARSLPSLPLSGKRTFFLHVTGWAKDQDPNTISSRSVSPLPTQGAREQTREVPALVTPLAPRSSSPPDAN